MTNILKANTERGVGKESCDCEGTEVQGGISNVLGGFMCTFIY